jgi:large subunit ribosomal protein L33
MAAITIKVKMVSTAGTGYYKTTTKNPRNVTEKLKLKMYDPKVRQHVIFEEKKVK